MWICTHPLLYKEPCYNVYTCFLHRYIHVHTCAFVFIGMLSRCWRVCATHEQQSFCFPRTIPLLVRRAWSSQPKEPRWVAQACAAKHELACAAGFHVRSHTHTHTYIYIYIEREIDVAVNRRTMLSRINRMHASCACLRLLQNAIVECYVGLPVCLSACPSVCLSVCACVRAHVRPHVLMYVCTFMHLCVCMHARMHVCTYMCVHGSS